MDRFIQKTNKLQDIKTKNARENLNEMVYYLCSALVPNKMPPHIKLIKDLTLETCHQEIASILYSNENIKLADLLLRSRAKIKDGDFVDGFAAIYDLKREILLELDTRKYFISVGALEHELIHLLQAINKNNPEPQYNEVLSFFGEIVTMFYLSLKYQKEDIFNNFILFRMINRMSYRVFGHCFEDAFIASHSEFINKTNLSLYEHMLGFIYAVQLFTFYKKDTMRIKYQVNEVLSGRKTMKSLLTENKINLENEEVVHSFKEMVDFYRNIVEEKYDKSNTHHV